MTPALIDKAVFLSIQGRIREGRCKILSDFALFGPYEATHQPPHHDASRAGANGDAKGHLQMQMGRLALSDAPREIR
jgi:hypothetical protein